MKIGFRPPSETAELITRHVGSALAAEGSPRPPIQGPSNGAVAFMARFPRREGAAAGVDDAGVSNAMEADHGHNG